MSKITDVDLSILADTDKPSDWELEDYIDFSQEAAREILKLQELLKSFVDDNEKVCPSCNYSDILAKGHHISCRLEPFLKAKL